MSRDEYEAIASRVDAEFAAITSVEAEKDKKGRPSQTDLLVRFAGEHFDLLHDKNGLAYAQDKCNGEVRRLGSEQFKNRLIADFYRVEKMAVRENSWREAVGTLQAIARHNGEAEDVFIRVASYQSRYYLDLAQPGSSRAVELCADGWQIIEKPPVRFVRSESTRPLPDPVRGGRIDALWHIANVPRPQRLLVVAWLVDCLRPDTPYPGLELIGEQGSGKSTTAEALRRLIDPSSCNLRSAPRCHEDVFIGAACSHVVAYENVSHLGGPTQDALAIMSTGGGFAKRQLYTDGDEHVRNVRRPWLINGISNCVTQQDLVDRVISIECPLIQSRQQSSQQWKDFEAALPEILGGLCEIAAGALAELPNMTLDSKQRPRLLEHALLGMAVAKACGQEPGYFLDAFSASRRDAVARTIDASPVASAVLALVEDCPNPIKASVKEILRRLDRYKPIGAGDAWPRSPKGLGDALRRAAPALRQVGVEVRSLGNIGGHIEWSITKKSADERLDVLSVVGVVAPGHDFMTSMTSGPELLNPESEGRL